MMVDVGKYLVYFDDETHLVRRLGAAVVARWAEIPDPIRRGLIDHATRVMDEDAADDIDVQINRFLDDHTAVSLTV